MVTTLFGWWYSKKKKNLPLKGYLKYDFHNFNIVHRISQGKVDGLQAADFEVFVGRPAPRKVFGEFIASVNKSHKL